MPTDAELLRQHVKDGSEAAFTEIVRRYAGLVYPAALRLVGGNAHLAKDVTQDVFILLARKAPMLIGHETLAGWLHTTTRHVAFRMIRSLRRREVREKEALAMQINSAPDVQWEQLRPLLDEAVGQLDDCDRDAVLLRYFQGKSFSEVGNSLDMTENTARVRTERAVEKLRRHFARSGVVTTGALLAQALSVNLAQATPPGLVADVAAVAHAKGLSLGHTILKAIYMTSKTKIVLATAAILAVAFIPLAVSLQNTIRDQRAEALQNGSDGSVKGAKAPNSGAPTEVAAPAIAPASPNTPSTAAAIVVQPQLKVDPRAPMPGVYPNAPTSRDLLASLTGQAKTSGPIVVSSGPMLIPAADMVRMRYGNFMQKMRFTPEQAESFIKILTDLQNKETAIRMQNPIAPQVQASMRTMTDGQVSAALAQYEQQLQPLMKAAERDTAAQLQPLLDGNEDYLQTYTDQDKERAVIASGGYADALDAAGVPPLTLDQEENLINLVYQYRTTANGNPIPPEQQTQILRQAASFISPDQVSVLQQFLPMLATPVPVQGTVIRGG